MFDEAKVRESVERARKNIQAMGGTKPGDVRVVEELALLILQTVPVLTDQAVAQIAARDTLQEMLTGKSNAGDYSENLTLNWIRKQAIYLVLEVLQNVRD